MSLWQRVLVKMGLLEPRNLSSNTDDDWRVGAIFAFSTTPYFKFSKPVTGRFAAFKILEITEVRTVVAVLDGVWTSIPSINEVDQCPILEPCCNPDFSSSKNATSVIAIPHEWGGDANTALQNLCFLGAIKVTSSEKKLVRNLVSHGTWHSVDYAAEGEWRFKNDYINFENEREKAKAISHAKWLAEQERYAKRLQGLTWDKLLAELPFERWKESPPVPSAEFAEAARQRIRDLCQQIVAFGPKPKKADVRKEIRACVEWFNEKHEADRSLIETEEREDICAILEEIAFVARHKSLIDDVEKWRNW
jgi:hypothetical protein